MATRGKVAFPNSNDSPSSFAQRARNNAITRDVLFKFRQTEINPRFRRVAELATFVPVPKTSVHEDADLLAILEDSNSTERLRFSLRRGTNAE